MLNDENLKAQLQRVLASVEQLLPKVVDTIDWSQSWAANWRRYSFAGYLEAINDLDPVTLDDLLGIDKQKQILEDNTRQFVRGFPANNVLLWGTRGTGKSTLVRALLNAYGEKGLRVIQVDKDDLVNLADIFAAIKGAPYRFIILCDDLSFEPGESSYKVLKSALDGAVYAAPEHVRFYVTSNRRHLLPEYETDNLGFKMVNNELHAGEGVEEKTSLSDRFGLWVPFHIFSQDQYLELVGQLVKKHSLEYQLNLNLDEELFHAALKWSHEKSKRCGRTALQFSRYWVGQQLLKQRK
ncbi:ATP-binding protein [uncultured Desulfuromusa sp.]|uniref:ATP-binding protein n=1 Tax=uncultured Desulfuromusa sp. TaxID=219183 RepID=UPI002AA617C7|nr:ATP-binding protein [uncultured Desulfuromusa sp.]